MAGSKKKKMLPRVGVIGAGLAGCLTALALARKGIPSQIYERNDRELSEASFHNEGKVHVGFLYSKDRTLDTSRLMINGARHFRGIIAQLTGFDVSESLSTPFLYGLHRESIVSQAEFAAHLDSCTRIFSSSNYVYPSYAGYVDGSAEVSSELLAPEAWSEDLSPESFSAVFRTNEYGVDPAVLCREVSRAVRSNPLIELHTSARVEKIIPKPGGSFAFFDSKGSRIGPAQIDCAINCSWADLLRLDRQVGIPLPVDWSYRYKLGSRISRATLPDDLDSVTVVLGPFGDIVNYGTTGGVFLSWYPAGLLQFTDEVDLPDWNGPGFKTERIGAYELSRTVWEGMSRKLEALNIGQATVDAKGGVILATGRLDVGDPASPLHSRVDIGISQKGSYFSLNPGKYTLAPLMACQTANKIQEHLSKA